MDETARIIIAAIAGEHTYDRRARAGNWFAMWVFITGAGLIAGLTEGYSRGWEELQVTPILLTACAFGAFLGALWIRSFNLTRFRIDEAAVECVTAWPRRSWKVWLDDVESAGLEPSRGEHWVVVLRLRAGGRRKLVLTRSMRQALELS